VCRVCRVRVYLGLQKKVLASAFLGTQEVAQTLDRHRERFAIARLLIRGV
jgi:hypothetical protein